MRIVDGLERCDSKICNAKKCNVFVPSKISCVILNAVISIQLYKGNTTCQHDLQKSDLHSVQSLEIWR